MSTCEGIDAEIQRTIDRIEDRADQIRQRELSRALSELDDLDSEERAAIERLAERLTERLVTPPKQGLRAVDGRDDRDAARVARELFGD